ncbi:MAG UNVERIFIED_CONTAM: hypothetical protein LVR18_35440 [Planctomycetaceae bacterium]
MVLAAGSVGDADYPVTKGKIAALDVLGQHYHHYPGHRHDVSISAFGGESFRILKTFLRDLITSSRHGFVRANAMYELANYLALEANLPCMCELGNWPLWTGQNQRMKLDEHFERFIASLKDVVIERNRAEAALAHRANQG